VAMGVSAEGRTMGGRQRRYVDGEFRFFFIFSF